jgi:predicted HAD superfamily phosphohydrolase
VDFIVTNIRQLYNNFIVKIQELIYTIGASKRIQIMSEYTDVKPNDTILDIGGNTGKITEASILITAKRLLYWSQNAML